MMVKDKKKTPGWKDIAEGNLIDRPATALEYKTGTWRAFRPIWIKENCIHCKFCWLYCPDMAIGLEGDKMSGFLYDYCKGCGTCAKICPAKKKAIEMKKETECDK
jgi:pyruvate ferredoxin oxidoreductase delta subunit